jgi:hypothetical protein
VTTNGLDVTVDDVADLFVVIIKAMMVRSEVMYDDIDGAIRSEFSDVQYNPTAMYAVPRSSSDNYNDNNNYSSSSSSSSSSRRRCYPKIQSACFLQLPGVGTPLI